MKKLLFILGLLLAMDCYCNYDTLFLASEITSIQVFPKGTLISQSTPLNLESGQYVIHLADLPQGVTANDIQITEADGITVLSKDLINKSEQLKEAIMFGDLHYVDDQVSLLQASIKALETKEKRLAQLKKFYQDDTLGLDESINFKTYYQKENTSIQKLRKEAYHKLVAAREESKAAQLIRSIPKKSEMIKAKNQLFVRLFLNKRVNAQLLWSYLIGNKQKELTNSLEMNESNTTTILPVQVDFRGRVVESAHGAPIIFANVDFFQKGKLVHSTSTDYNGLFKLPLKTQESYDVVISFSGYKKRKLKDVVINQVSIPEQIISMQAKNKVSALELMGYSLPFIELLRIIAD